MKKDAIFLDRITKMKCCNIVTNVVKSKYTYREEQVQWKK